MSRRSLASLALPLALASAFIAAPAWATDVPLAFDVTVDEFDPVFGNALPPQIGDALVVRLDLPDASLDFPAVNDVSVATFPTLPFEIRGGGLDLSGTGVEVTVVNARDGAPDTASIRLFTTALVPETDPRLRFINLFFRSDAGLPAGTTRFPIGLPGLETRFDMGEIPAGGFAGPIVGVRIVPEPGTAMLLGLGLAGLARSRRVARA